MIKNKGLKVLLMTLVLISLASDALAQTNIKFARGRNSATVKGSIDKNGALRYTVEGKAGQTILVTVKSGNDQVIAGVEGVGQGQTVTGKLQYDGSYIIELQNGGNATNYAMTVTIR
ncbi:MAG: hypothetical protein JWN60_1575 [Acidobacteria bacterium]|jgi:hypothetical protein|nr:hypothetical protein [Acidobacteriota bacterium]